ncbi:alanine-glyoxylate aminotransferase apoenzyme [Abditibacterium utsteinense]|uniref:Alanine-glyoxylate aminotransferase apoenzyme n=1 Tax=Abditibacterium utsteinense TaxID=1960156 RepID=A0A2S8SS16_9BACT|nr:alanine--glyoxylate aminotransferase family protein [Abditibacterium utsteinense]PQV63604.1 alanine-glyoxylate aminotransferase apoenzyme [Abditibacterium utsteinense]
MSQSSNGLPNGSTSHSEVFDINSIPEIKIPPRVLMGAGPSASYPEALRAMGANTLGHLDPEFLGIMSNVGTMLKRVFKTENPITGAIPGTGTAGMEAALCNLIEPGDHVLALVFGYFSNRMKQMAERMGAVVTMLERPWGTAFTNEEVEVALRGMEKPKVVMVVHAETSTGILQPIDEITKIAHKYGALVVVDAVTSLAGCPLLTDEWDTDVVFSGTQKCIGAPPGLSPITFNPRAMDAIRNRKVPVQSWYFDMSLVETYWGDQAGGGGRAYHYTAPSNALFGLHEALRMTLIEGLENRHARHELHSKALMTGLQTMGLDPFAQEGYRLWQINAVKVPKGLDDQAVRTRLLKDYNIEIGAGLGPVKGQIWRVGVMGYSANRSNVLLLLSAMEDILADLGHPIDQGSATEAAQSIYHDYDRAKTIKEAPIRLEVDHDEANVGESIPSESVARGVAHR